MPNSKVSTLRTESGREPFITIDDLVQQAEELTAGLKKLGEHKYPLDIRRGVKVKRKGVKDMAEPNESMTVKAGSKTYFFDIKKTKEDKPYLVITESRFKGEGEERERQAIIVFLEQAQEFADAVNQMVAKLG